MCSLRRTPEACPCCYAPPRCIRPLLAALVDAMSRGLCQYRIPASPTPSIVDASFHEVQTGRAAPPCARQRDAEG